MNVTKVCKKIMILSAVIFLTGCSLFSWRKAEIYNMSYDKTYNTTLSALDDMEKWKLVQTDMQNGVIVISNVETYLRPEQIIKLKVKRIEPFRTKIELSGKCATPFTQKFFKAIDKRVADQILTNPS